MQVTINVELRAIPDELDEAPGKGFEVSMAMGHPIDKAPRDVLVKVVDAMLDTAGRMLGIPKEKGANKEDEA